MNLLEPKEISIQKQNGNEIKIFISKFPAVTGRHIITQYPLTGAPKIGNYKDNEALMLLMMKYVGIKLGDNIQRFETEALIENHIGDWEALARIEREMMVYNCSFFQPGKISTFLDNISQNSDKLISLILTALSEQLSTVKEQPSTNSNTSTH